MLWTTKIRKGNAVHYSPHQIKSENKVNTEHKPSTIKNTFRNGRYGSDTINPTEPLNSTTSTWMKTLEWMRSLYMLYNLYFIFGCLLFIQVKAKDERWEVKTKWKKSLKSLNSTMYEYDFQWIPFGIKITLKLLQSHTTNTCTLHRDTHIMW